jgi:N-acylneuraminate cytidylyltransferase
MRENVSINGKRILALICARGGSKGIPRKNIRSLGGKPLIAWSILVARKCQGIDRIVVSTDDAEIAAIAREFGAETPFLRPEELARDGSPEWSVWRHALETLETFGGYRPEILINIPPTAPFRSPEDLVAAVQALEEGDTDMVISVSEARRNPYFNMIEMDGKGFAYLCKKNHAGLTRRQDAPPVYDMTTVVYAARPEYVFTSEGLFQGKVRAVVIPEIRALDIDTPLDWKYAEFLLSEGLVALP